MKINKDIPLENIVDTRLQTYYNDNLRENANLKSKFTEMKYKDPNINKKLIKRTI